MGPNRHIIDLLSLLEGISRMNTWYKRGLAILMTVAMLLSQMTVFAADPPGQELPKYTSGLYRKPYVPNTQDNEPIGGEGNNTVSFDNQSPYIM